MNNFDPMNPGGFNYGTPISSPNNWGQSRQYGGYSNYVPSAPRLNTNAIFVTSLDEALIKTDMCNSDMIYFNQDKNEFYRIKTDLEGRKSWAVFSYTIPNQDDNVPATKADFVGLVARIEALEKSTSKRKITEEGVDNAELDG